MRKNFYHCHKKFIQRLQLQQTTGMNPEINTAKGYSYE
jgi:hypothetical protein